MPPSTATLATELPLIIPKRELEKTETLAGPPRQRPKKEFAQGNKKFAGPGHLEESTEQHEEEDDFDHGHHHRSKNGHGSQHKGDNVPWFQAYMAE